MNSLLDTDTSRYFNLKGWAHARKALIRENGRKGVGIAKVGSAVNKLRAVRFDAKVEEQKVVNVMGIDTDDKVSAAMDSVDNQRAMLLGMTVKDLRAACKRRGIKRYSKAKHATLVDMLMG